VPRPTIFRRCRAPAVDWPSAAARRAGLRTTVRRTVRPALEGQSGSRASVDADRRVRAPVLHPGRAAEAVACSLAETGNLLPGGNIDARSRAAVAGALASA
jgi:hypothetical protein